MYLKVVFFLLTATLALSGTGFGAASAGIPLDSWTYPALDKLAGLGLVESALQGSRPWSRLEAARQVAEALEHPQRPAAPPVAGELLARLQREFAWELEDLQGSERGGYLLPLRRLRLDYLHREGEPAVYPGSQISARQFPLNTNRWGIEYDDRSNLQLLAESEARIGRSLLLNWQPLLLYGEDEGTDLRTLQGGAALALGPFQLEAGRQALWWGQGRHGTLVLTNNAEPFDMVRLTNPSPVLLPWVLKFLGPMRFDVFWSELDDYVANPVTGRGNDPYFAGLRLNFKPLPWMEIGASRAVMFGGDRIDVDWDEFVTILGGKNLGGGEDSSNSVAAVDGRLRLPFLWGLELYGEYGGEDEANGWLANHAWLAGLYLPRLEPTGRVAVRLEYADLSRIDDNSPVWYRHGTYRSGYTHEEKIMGHHVGGAGTDLFLGLELFLPGGVTLRPGIDWEERGYDQPVREEHLQPHLELEWDVRSNLALSAAYALDRVENFHYLRGNDETLHLARIGFVLHW